MTQEKSGAFPPSRKVMLILPLITRSLYPLLAERAVDCWRVAAMEEEEGHICSLVPLSRNVG